MSTPNTDEQNTLACIEAMFRGEILETGELPGELDGIAELKKSPAGDFRLTLTSAENAESADAEGKR